MTERDDRSGTNESLALNNPEPETEDTRRGDLYFLWHPNTLNTLSGYGLTFRPESKLLLNLPS